MTRLRNKTRILAARGLKPPNRKRLRNLHTMRRTFIIVPARLPGRRTHPERARGNHNHLRAFRAIAEHRTRTQSLRFPRFRQEPPRRRRMTTARIGLQIRRIRIRSARSLRPRKRCVICGKRIIRYRQKLLRELRVQIARRFQAPRRLQTPDRARPSDPLRFSAPAHTPQSARHPQVHYMLSPYSSPRPHRLPPVP